jgi:hypothetical protein
MPPDTKLRRQLGMKQGQRLAIVNMPYWFLERVGFINNTYLGGENTKNPDYVQIFTDSVEELERSLEVVMRNFKPGAILWICHPDGPGSFKLNSGRAARLIAERGLEKVKELPLNNLWKACRFREVSIGKSVAN